MGMGFPIFIDRDNFLQMAEMEENPAKRQKTGVGSGALDIIRQCIGADQVGDIQEFHRTRTTPNLRPVFVLGIHGAVWFLQSRRP